MNRAERAVEAARLKGEGLNGIQIAERMGISRSYAYGLLNDPDGSADRAKKDRYRRPCPSCGRMMDGSNGGRSGPEFCCHCAPAENREWPRERIIEALRKFNARFGRSPGATDFNVAIARSRGQTWRVARYEAGEWPSTNTVVNEFGSWNAGLEAAGLQTRKVSEYPRIPGRLGGAHLEGEREVA